MKKMNDPGGPVMKPLAELTLLDRFLFACVMEDRRTIDRKSTRLNSSHRT